MAGRRTVNQGRYFPPAKKMKTMIAKATKSAQGKENIR
jgi:hypothetical protein